jgi:thioredoxin 2
MNTDARTHAACPSCGATNRVPTERLGQDPVCGRCGTALLSGQPLELTDANLDAFLKASELPVVLDFWAPWCGPCRQMAPQFQAAAVQLKGQVVFAKVNSDDNPQASARFGIRSIPTLVKWRGGQERARQAGALPAAQIVAWARS